MSDIENNEVVNDVQLDDQGNPVIAESAASDSLRPGGGTAGAGDTKAETLAGIVVKLSSLSNDDLNGFKASLDQIGNETKGMNGSADANRASIAAKSSAASIKKVVKEDLQNLFGEEETLSEGFIDKATTLFEAAVTARVETEMFEINEQIETLVEERTQAIVEDFSERLDTYLDYIAERWLEENRVQVEAGVKTELTESFLEGMRTLFAEHYVEMPEDKVDIVEALTDEIDQLTEQLNVALNENIELLAVDQKKNAAAIVTELAEGMTDADAERLRMLTEDIEYTDADEYRAKAELVRNSFFTEAVVTDNNGLILEEVQVLGEGELAESAEKPALTPAMQRYADVISRNVKGL